MYVCICNAVTDSDIRDAVDNGARDLWGLQSALGVASGCGSCKQHAMEVLTAKRKETHSQAEPRTYSPAVA